MTKRLDVELQKSDDGGFDLVGIRIWSSDGSPMTGQQILEAVSEALVLHWDYNPLEEMSLEDFDA